MEKKLVNTLHTYSYELKKKAINLYFEGYARGEIADLLGIKNKRLINEWVLKVHKEGLTGITDRRGLKKGLNQGRPLKRTLTLEEENQRLKAENLYLKKLIEQKRGC